MGKKIGVTRYHGENGSTHTIDINKDETVNR